MINAFLVDYPKTEIEAANLEPARGIKYRSSDE